MIRSVPLIVLLLLTHGITAETLFNGKGLKGWKSNEETPGCFTVLEDGSLQVKGGRAHLFWVGKGDVPAEYSDFIFTAKVKTTSGSNSGIFFHTQYQDTGWPIHGYEAQVNTTHKDVRKTGSIYAVQDIHDAPSVDGEWFDYKIKVEGKDIKIFVNGKLLHRYAEPDPLVVENEKHKNRRLSKGTFAIQAHDPNSITYYKDIKVRVVEEEAVTQ